MNRIVILACCVMAWGNHRGVAAVFSPASERFSVGAADESPDFRRHVMPLLSKLGCNGRACHGSFQGRGGFRLSLFGHDFAADLASIAAAGDEGVPRIDRGEHDRSLLLLKPTERVPHEGGKRFEAEGWEHELLRRWIADGAVSRERGELSRLEVTPADISFHGDADRRQLRVLAHWSDGAIEDVTCLSRFESLDPEVASVTAAGLVCSTGGGDTHVTVFYDRAVSTASVLRAVNPDVARDYPTLTPTTKIDAFVLAKLRPLGIVPSHVCSDTEFLRRASIDLTGTLPTPSEIDAFVADVAVDKRAAKIDELLDRPAYAAWWANKLCDFTGCNPGQQSELGQEVSVQWYTWIFERLREGMAYDDLVEGMLLAKSRRGGQSYEEYVAEMSTYFGEGGADRFARRADMPHYWSRRALKTNDDRALAFAHSFLGVRLQCAQCHKHPYDQWTQDDFAAFGALVGDVRHGVAGDAVTSYRTIAEGIGAVVDERQGAPIREEHLARAAEGKLIPWRELYVETASEPRTRVIPCFGEITIPANADPRRGVMDWLRRSDNPYFSRVFVNRVWANYFHRGLIEPTDDLSAANPPSNAPLLDHLASEFVNRGYDMRWLHREITLSDTYQRSIRANATNVCDDRHFSRAVPRRLPAEVVYDAIKQVTAGDAELDAVRDDLTRRAVGHLSMRMSGTYAMQVFGKPERAVNCDCERVSQPALLQTVFLHNDPLLTMRLEGSGWLAAIEKLEENGALSPADLERLVAEAYLRVLGRRPDAPERERARAHLEATANPRDAVEDLLWALLNTKEFILNH